MNAERQTEPSRTLRQSARTCGVTILPCDRPAWHEIEAGHPRGRHYLTAACDDHRALGVRRARAIAEPVIVLDIREADYAD